MKTYGLAWLFFPSVLFAQADPRVRAKDQAEFLTRARTAAVAYVKQEDALLDGYRPIGPELPAMGQHWLNPEFANSGYVDPARPAFLLYVTIDGKPTLGGLGYTLALKPGEKLPELPAGRNAWHEHAGSVADEAFAVSHHTVDDESRFRVVALHVWHALPAPDGLFSAENWSLPFVRNSVPLPSRFAHDAARMLALTHGGDAYTTEVIARHASLGDAEKTKVATLLAQYARTVRQTPVDRLPRLYQEMWAELLAALPEGDRERVRVVKELWTHNSH